MASLSATAAAAVESGLSCVAAAAAETVKLNVSAITDNFNADGTAVYYSDSPLLLGNDGGTSTGGFQSFDLEGDTPLPSVQSVLNGRTKLLTTVYDVADKDWLLTIATADSMLRAFELPELEEEEDAAFKVLGDWSALCPWRSETGNQYAFLFGKEQGIQFLIRSNDDDLEMVEVQSFAMPWEANACAASAKAGRMYLSSGLDDPTVFYFPLAETTETPTIGCLGEADDEVSGLAVYVTEEDSDYIFVAQDSVVAVYDQEFELLGTLEMAGFEDIEVEGLQLYQAASSKYPAGALTYAIEADDEEVEGFGVSSLEDVAAELCLSLNTEYDPSDLDEDDAESPICEECSENGFCRSGDEEEEDSKCSCFAGLTGDDCSEVQCIDDCSGHGECAGPNMCECEPGWGGPTCSFLVVEPTFETEENGNDVDDPAIWISPEAAEKSRVITTTKSDEDSGLNVFDLEGKLMQSIPAPKPNNVDVIYGFTLGNRTVDLAYAACRGDDTLCMFEITPEGALANVTGGIQPVEEEFSVYGSCTYRSPTTDKQYLFVNEKSARYLQYELTSTVDGTLETTLVRDFTGGSGGQVEGCVSDEENGWLFVGEEPLGLWRYDAEPDGGDEGFKFAELGDGTTHVDVEGVTLVLGDAPDKGFIIASMQGVSAYNVYLRAEPHAFVTTFTIGATADGGIDAVTNTDGVAAVGTALGPNFPRGLVVVQDDSNELPDGSTSDQSSFKMVSLEKIIGAEAYGELDLLAQVDASWDPRASLGE